MLHHGISSNLGAVRERIARAARAHGRAPQSVTLIAVAKTKPAAAIAEAHRAGQLDFGENYAQEAAAKAEALAGLPLRWHFIGRLQRNKIRKIAHLVDLWQSVDRIEAAVEIARRAPGARVLVQVDVAGIGERGGCPPTDTAQLVTGCQRAGLEVVGLMAVGEPGPPERARPGFRLLAAQAADLGLSELSMGMSGDIEIAVEEGATMVRVGTALFGPRPR